MEQQFAYLGMMTAAILIGLIVWLLIITLFEVWLPTYTTKDAFLEGERANKRIDEIIQHLNEQKCKKRTKK